MTRLRTAAAAWWSRSAAHWRALPQNARLAGVAGLLLIVVLVATGAMLATRPAGPGPEQPGSASPQLSPSEVAVASPTNGETPSAAPSEQPSVQPTASPSPLPTPSPTPSPTAAASVTAPTVARFPCKPYPDGQWSEPVVSGNLLYIFCKPTGDKSTEAVVAIDLTTNKIVRTYDFEFVFDPFCVMTYCSWDDDLILAVDHGLWVGSLSGLERLDLETGVATVGHNDWKLLAHTPGRIWADVPHDQDTGERVIQALNPSTGKATRDPGYHYVESYSQTFGACSSMVFVDKRLWDRADVTLELLTPTPAPSAWPVPLTEILSGELTSAGQADGACWVSMTESDPDLRFKWVQMSRIGLNGIEFTGDAIHRVSDLDSIRVSFYEGRAWLVTDKPEGTYIQGLELPSMRLGRPMRIPVKWLGIAGGSVWALDAKGFLVRLAIPGATPAPQTPTPAPTHGPTTTPTPSAS